MEYHKPADIERRSMEIIDRELVRRGIHLPEENAAVIRRVIHTTADFDYVDRMVFTQDAVSAGIRALQSGTSIVTDTNMALAGISKPGLQALGTRAMCFMADPDVAEAAKARETTRAAVCVEKAARLAPGCIYAVGNAPTALFALLRQMEQGFRPAMIIGVPVGFVNVVEAKEAMLSRCMEQRIPAIIARGRKGGSTVAAAILNAMLYRAMQNQ